MSPFCDWLSVFQRFDERMPLIAKEGISVINFETGEHKSCKQMVSVEGSFDNKLYLIVKDDTITIRANPSAILKLDNLYGHTTLDACFDVFNRSLTMVGLPRFTKCTEIYRTIPDRQGKMHWSGNGAKVTRVDLTTNKTVGPENTLAYIRGLAGLQLGRNDPFLYPNGRTVDWRTEHGNSRLTYSKCYDKGYQLRLKTLPRIKRVFGENSTEFEYIKNLTEFCEQQGVVRYETQFNSEWLSRNCTNYWGKFELEQLYEKHSELVNIDNKLQVTNMSLEGIAERLQSLHIVDTTRAANTTALYAIQWMSGQKFDKSKTQVQTHRARLRQIGIDICKQCDISVTSPVFIKKATEIEVNNFVLPSWYQHTYKKAQLRVVA